jgi:hypothetical protein
MPGPSRRFNKPAFSTPVLTIQKARLVLAFVLGALGMEDGVLVSVAVGVSGEVLSNKPHARDENSKSSKTIFFKSAPFSLFVFHAALISSLFCRQLAVINFIQKCFRGSVIPLAAKSMPALQVFRCHSFQQSRERNTWFIPTLGTRTRSQHERGACFSVGDVAASGCIISPRQVWKIHAIY